MPNNRGCEPEDKQTSEHIMIDFYSREGVYWYTIHYMYPKECNSQVPTKPNPPSNKPPAGPFFGRGPVWAHLPKQPCLSAPDAHGRFAVGPHTHTHTHTHTHSHTVLCGVCLCVLGFRCCFLPVGALEKCLSFLPAGSKHHLET